jgi:sulfate adenylyltransferase subunit 1
MTSHTQDFENFLQTQENKTLLRFITCGSVDDGKSTLIGRLLHDSKAIFEDQLSSLENDSKKNGTTGEKIDFALLVDGLQSEREQGITIDVAYRYFSTDKRKYIIADTPGHEQYTRNMATGASTADLAIILIDARKGVLTQTRRHSYIASLLGIKHIVVAINKMDLVGYSQDRFEEIKKEYQHIIPLLPNNESTSFEYIPICAVDGDNVVAKSANLSWYQGNALIRILDSVDISTAEGANQTEFRFPVQYVNRPHLDFRGFCGTIASGCVSVGDEITVLPSGKSTRIKSIIPPTVQEVTIESASAPMAVTLTTQDEIDISRGDIIVHSAHLPRVDNSLKVMMVWMDEKPMAPHQDYLFKVATTVVTGSFEHINYKVDVNSYEKVQIESLALNDIASCKIVLNRPIVVDSYRKNRSTGAFIVIDRMTNSTVGAGMIVDVSRREGDKVAGEHRKYTPEEIELNAYIRKHFPEWGCKAI